MSASYFQNYCKFCKRSKSNINEYGCCEDCWPTMYHGINLIWFECKKCRFRFNPFKLEEIFEDALNDQVEEIIGIERSFPNINYEELDEQSMNYFSDLSDKLEELRMKIHIISNVDFDYDKIDGGYYYIIEDDLKTEYHKKSRIEFFYEFYCEKCNHLINVTIYADAFSLNNPEQIIYRCFNSRDLLLNGKTFSLVKGIQIRVVINFLMRFWAFDRKDLIFCSPFLHFYDWLNLISLTKSMYYWFQKPKIILITRENQSDWDLKIQRNLTIEEKLDIIAKMLKNDTYVCHRSNIKVYRKESEISIEEINGLESIYEEKELQIKLSDELNGIVKRITLDDFNKFIPEIVKNRVKFNSQFHSKFYAGGNLDLNDDLEIINTSFNYIRYEDDQLESFSFIIAPNSELTNHLTFK